MKITINGTELYKVKRGTTYAERLDEELDTGVIVAYNSQAEEYAPMSIVEIFITNTETPDVTMLVDQDESILIKKDTPKLYQHTIALIEPTKHLERVICDGIGFTQPRAETAARYTLGDVLQRLEDITPLDNDQSHAASRLFKIDNAWKNEWDAMASPQFYFKSGMSAMQILTEICRYKNAFPRIKSFDENGIPIVTKDNLNEVKSTISLPHIINSGKANNSEYYIGKLDIQLENAITDRVETFPPEPNLTVMTTPSYVMNTEELEIKVPNPIYAIQKVVMMVRYSNYLTTSTETFIYKEIDITDRVYEEAAYNTLDLEEKYTALVYKKGDRVIKNFGVSFPQLFGLFLSNNFVDILSDINSQEVTLPNGTTTYVVDQFNAGDRSYTGVAAQGADALRGYYGFRIYYYPYISPRINILKQQGTAIHKYAATTNQAAPALSVERAANNAQGVIDRTGNSDLMYEMAFTNWSNRIQVGQRLPNGYIVTSVEYQIQEGIYKAKAVLNKNFNRLSQFVGVDREFRQYEIPFDQAIDRNLIYNQYITLDTTDASTNLSTTATSFKNWLRYMFTTSHATYDDYTIGAMLFTTNKAGEPYPIGNFLMSVAKTGHSNSVILYSRFESNVVAYQYPVDNLQKKTAEGFTKLLTTLTNRKYTYDNDADPDDVANGTFDTMRIRILDQDFIKSVDDLVISVANITAANAHYATRKATYPYGLFYKLGSAWTDTDGHSWNYVLLNNTYAKKEWGFYPQDVLRELLYSYSYDADNTYLNHKAFTSHGKWLQSNYPAPRFQRELYTDAQQNNLTKYLKTDFTKVDILDLVVKKDPMELISLTYQLHFIPSGNVIIGTEFALKSPYLAPRSTQLLNDRLLYLYRSTSLYSQGASTTLGDRNGTILQPFKDITTGSTTGGFYVECPSAYLTNYNSWAVGDYGGELYFAVNRDPDTNALPNRIYFNYKDKL